MASDPAVPHTVWMALPSPKRFRELLESQLHREVQVRPADPLPPTAPHVSLAIYVDDHLATQAVVVVDLPAAVHLGAASALIPVGVAKAALAERGLPSLVERRFRSVLENWAQLFSESGEHPDSGVHLYNAVLPGEQAPADVVSLAAAPGQRLDLALTVRAYGEGRVSLVRGR